MPPQAQAIFRAASVPKASSHAGYSYETETLAYGTAITNNAGTISSNDFYSVDTFVKSAKSIGYWSSLLDASPMAGNNTNAAAVKLVWINNVTSSNLVWVGGAPAWSNNIGVIGNGSSVYINPQYSFVNNGAVAHGMTIFETRTETLLPSSPWSVCLGVHSGGGLGFTFLGPGSPNSDTIDIYDHTIEYGASGGLFQYNSTRPSLGVQALLRTDATHSYYFINGQLRGQTSGSAGNQSDAVSPYFLAMNSVGSPAYYSGASCGWYSIDNGMATNLVPAFHSNLWTLMRSLNRIPVTYPQPAYLIIGQSRAVAGGTGSASGVNGGYVGTDGAASVFDNYMPDCILRSCYAPNVWLNGYVFKPSRSKIVETRNPASGSKVTTGWKAFADQISSLCRSNSFGTTNDSFVLNWAEAGLEYNSLSKTNTTNELDDGVSANHYTLSTREVALQDMYQTNYFGQHLKFMGLISVHGESDYADPNYGLNMLQWQSDYNGDITNITKQANGIPMFHTQQPSYTNQISNTNMLWLHQNYPGTHCLVGPVYFLKYSDGTHPTNFSCNVQAEYYAKAVYKKLISGAGYDPLYPTNVARVGAAITLTFTGCVGNLALDNTTVSDPGHYGFQYTDSSSPPAISTVTVSGNQATVTLASTPTGSGKTLSYAFPFTGMQNNQASTNSCRGCLRDSDTIVGYTSGTNLWNWAVHFSVSVP